MEEFTKDMLRSGYHVVELRSGERFLCLRGFIVGENRSKELFPYTDDLLDSADQMEDIVKVFLLKSPFGGLKDALYHPGDLIWERKKKVTISKAEALKKLAEIYGEEVKVEW